MCRAYVLLGTDGVRDRVSPAVPGEHMGKATPVSNTGSNCHPTDVQFDLTAKVDYVTCIVPVRDREHVFEFLNVYMAEFKDMLTVSEDKGQFIGKQYSHAARSPRGALFTWNLVEDGNGDAGSLRMALGGQVLAHIRQDDLVLFLRTLLYEHKAKFSRVDLAIDDYSKVMDPRLIVEAYADGNFARFRKFKQILNYKNGELSGWTLNFGSRESDSFVRYYDKDVESKGHIPAWRLEAEFKDDKASKVVDTLCLLPLDDLHDHLGELLGKLVVGEIDFPDRQGTGRRIDRCKPLPWWKEFQDRVGGSIRVVCPRPKPTLHRKAKWIRDQVIPSIATLEIFHELESMSDFFSNQMRCWINSAKEKLSDNNHALISSARMEPFLDLRDIDHYLHKYSLIC